MKASDNMALHQWRKIQNKQRADDFYEIPENRADIVLHQAAKKFFEEHKIFV
jgi:hypothetical protein